MKVNVCKLDPKAILPTYGSAEAAGADLYILADTLVKAGETVLAHTGISMEIPNGYVGLVFARSGLAAKRDLAPANKVGVIDSDYRGEIMVALHNHGAINREISAGERIAQIVLVPYLTAEFTETDALSDTDRGAGGFGSTGTK